MKKLIFVMVGVLLLLSGCTKEDTQPVEETYTLTLLDEDDTVLFSEDVIVGTALSTLDIPTELVKEDYTFTGWALPDTMPKGDITLTAVYEPNPIKIGYLASLTGMLGTYGTFITNGINLAVSEINEAGGINGHEIELIVEDVASNIANVDAAFDRLMEQEVVAVIGGVFNGVSLYLSEYADGAEVPIITPSANAEDITIGIENYFRMTYTDVYQATMTAQFVAEETTATKVAVLYNSDLEPFTTQAIQFANEAALLGITVEPFTYSNEVVDYTTYFEAMESFDPDLIYAPSSYDDNLDLVNDAEAYGLDVPFIGSDGWAELAYLTTTKLNGDFYSAMFNRYDEGIGKVFADKYLAMYGKLALSYEPLGYDTVYVLKAALVSANSYSYTDMISALHNLGPVETVSGFNGFDSNGDAIKDITFFQVIDGESVYITTKQEE